MGFLIFALLAYFLIIFHSDIRDILLPKRFRNKNSDSFPFNSFGLPETKYLLMPAIAFFPNGITRSLFPLPMQRKNPISRLTLSFFKFAASDTRMPVA